MVPRTPFRASVRSECSKEKVTFEQVDAVRNAEGSSVEYIVRLVFEPISQLS